MTSARSPLTLPARLATLAALLLTSLALASPGRLDAQAAPATSAGLSEAEVALTRYDLSAPETWSALTALRRIADENGPDAARARFVRAYAGVDLFVATTILDDAGARSRLFEAFSVADAAALRALLVQELARTPPGVLARAASDARSTLSALEGGSARLDARTAAIALVRAGAAPAQLLPVVEARFDPVVDASLEILPAHAERARRIIAALRMIARADALAEAGDPLLALVRPRLADVRAGLSEIVLADPEYEDIDAFLTVGAREVSFGYVPRTRVDPSGAPRLESGRPVWPQATSIPLPSDASTSARPLRELSAAPSLRDARPARVAIRVEGDVSVSLLARVLRALEGSPLTVTHVATPLGRVRVRVLDEASAGPTPPVQIVVRPGGYAIQRRGARSVDVPRLRLEGRRQYDHEALVHGIPESGERVVTGTGLASAAELLEVAVLVARESGVALALP